jgi:hypothetical protein
MWSLSLVVRRSVAVVRRRGAHRFSVLLKPYGFTDFTRQCTEKIKKGAGMSMWLQESLSDNC